MSADMRRQIDVEQDAEEAEEYARRVLSDRAADPRPTWDARNRITRDQRAAAAHDDEED